MRSGFFNSNISGYDEYGNPQYDRAEDAAFFAAFFAAFIGNGVYPNPSDGMQVIENSNLGVLIKPGKCFINGYFGLVEEGGEILSFDTADTTLSRIDRVVARWDLQSRDINLFVVKGNPASNPVAPELTRNSNIYELGLADVKITANATVITQANITDTRLNANLCGVVAGVIEQVDTTTLFNQYIAWFEGKQAQADSDYQEWFDGFTTPSEAEFKAWFENVKGQLSEDAAGNLQNQIENIADTLRVVQEMLEGTILYEGNTATTESLPLNDTILNYKTIKVHVRCKDNQVSVLECDTSLCINGVMNMPLWCGSIASDGVFYGHTARCYLNKSIITLDRIKTIAIKSSAMVQADYVEAFTILKVIGYK